MKNVLRFKFKRFRKLRVLSIW